MTNKETALSFLRWVTSGKIREAYNKNVAPGFRHHNPYFKGNAQSLMAGMEENDSKFPGKRYEVHRTIEDGDTVAVHGHVILKPGEFEIATVHIFRFQAGKIVELWDIGQRIPKESPNENGMF